jgi:hypothetical protein
MATPPWRRIRTVAKSCSVGAHCSNRLGRAQRQPSGAGDVSYNARHPNREDPPLSGVQRAHNPPSNVVPRWAARRRIYRLLALVGGRREMREIDD